ncbi:hypothetical protein LOC67_23345 [Stieleria sp. JC731]|uniref:hypothetical protein n=1 Tax=Pirellulaceae TaxID=2691357 RepID=UPI001E646CE5|nr:hypothetical protein [Stieleria sp. JC731]MCC9603495.1 hypothetical protein [Stieleria sp. JC731]
MYAEISLAKVKTAPTSASGLACTKFTADLLYPDYSAGGDAPTLKETEGEPVDVIWTWNGTCPVDTVLVLGRITEGDWIVISEACDD